ncbi:MAG: hypothetical protein ACLUHE_16410 [Christensenellales bacterium]
MIEKGVTPHLAVVVAGENPASQVYVRNKENVQPRGHSLNGSAAAGKLHTGRALEGAVLALNADEQATWHSGAAAVAESGLTRRAFWL